MARSIRGRRFPTRSPRFREPVPASSERRGEVEHGGVQSGGLALRRRASI
jgi:hypothetical protein